MPRMHIEFYLVVDVRFISESLIFIIGSSCLRYENMIQEEMAMAELGYTNNDYTTSTVCSIAQ